MRFRNALFIIAALSLLIIAAGFLFSNPERPGTGVKYDIHITSSGFNPRILNIKVGDTLVFINDDIDRHWVASDVHDTHNVYPEKGGCIGSKFDQCDATGKGGVYEFTFFYRGSWCYHDHLNPTMTGCVDAQ